MHRGRNSIVPRFAPTSLTTTTVKWLHEESWDDTQKARFLCYRQAPPVGLYAPVPFTRKRRSTLPHPVGKWLLEGIDAKAFGAAEVQVQVANFASVQILLSSCDGGGSWLEGEPRVGLNLFISAIILLCRADTLRLVPLSGACGQEFMAFGFGAIKQLWTPYAADARLRYGHSGLSVATLNIDPVEWWTTDFGAAARKTLSYLEKRMQSEVQPARPDRPSPGLLGRLGRLFGGR